MGSVESEIFLRLTKRTILVMQTLYKLRVSPNFDRAVPWGGFTYNPPKANITISASFCLLGISIAIKAGIGIIRIARSVLICILAFENHRPGLLKQNPGRVGFQNLATGMQVKKALTTHQVPYMPRIVIITQQTMRIRRVGKTRKYCMRMEAFAQRTAAL